MHRPWIALVLTASLFLPSAFRAGESPASGTAEPPALATHYYRCQHAKGEAMKEILDTLTTPRGRVTFSEPLNLIVVTDEPERLKILREADAILQVDQPIVLATAGDVVPGAHGSVAASRKAHEACSHGLDCLVVLFVFAVSGFFIGVPILPKEFIGDALQHGRGIDIDFHLGRGQACA